MAKYITSEALAKFSDTEQIPISRVRVWDTPFSVETSGLVGKYYLNPDLSGVPARTQYDPQPYYNYGVGVPAGMPPTREFSVSWSGLFYAEHTGTYDWRVACNGGFRLYIGNWGTTVDEQPYMQQWPQLSTVLSETFSGGNGETWSGLRWAKNNEASDNGSISVSAGELLLSAWKNTAGLPEAHRFLYTKNCYSARSRLRVRAKIKVNNLTDARSYPVTGGIFLIDGISANQDGWDFKGLWIGTVKGTNSKTSWIIRKRTSDDEDWEQVYEDATSTQTTKAVEVEVDNSENISIKLDNVLVYNTNNSDLTINDYYLVLDHNTSGNSAVQTDLTYFDNIYVETESASSDINFVSASGIDLTKETWYPIRVDFTKTANLSSIGLFYSEPDTSPDFGREKVLTHGVLNCHSEYIQPTNLSNVIDINFDDTSENIGTLSFSVPATTTTNGIYSYNTTTRDWGILKKNRLVEYSAGIRTDDPPLESDYIPQFKGFIDSIELTRDKMQNILTVNCRTIGKRLLEHINENFPDPLSYDTINLYDYINTAGPHGIQRPQAYDGWLMTDAVRDLCIKAGIDSRYLWAKDKDGFNLIEDTGTRLEKSVKYFLPSVDNDEFNYAFDFGEYLYDMVRRITDGYGYEFRINPSGIILRTYDNPVITNSANASLNDWTKVEFGDGDVLYNQSNIFTSTFSGTTWDYTKWNPSTSGLNNSITTGNGPLSVTNSIIQNNDLELNTNYSGLPVTDYPYIVTTSGFDISYERKFKFNYTLPAYSTGLNIDQYTTICPSGTYNEPLQNHADWIGVRVHKGIVGTQSNSNEVYSLEGKINGIPIPHQRLNPLSAYPVPFIGTSDGSQRTQEFTIDVKQKSDLIVKENFDGSTWDASWFTASVMNGNSNGSVTTSNGKLAITTYPTTTGDVAGRALSMARTFDVSESPRIISFNMLGGTLGSSGTYTQTILGTIMQKAYTTTQAMVIGTSTANATSLDFLGDPNRIELRRIYQTGIIESFEIDIYKDGKIDERIELKADAIYAKTYPYNVTKLSKDEDGTDFDDLDIYIILYNEESSTDNSGETSDGSTLLSQNKFSLVVYINGRLAWARNKENYPIGNDLTINFYQTGYNSANTTDTLKIDNFSIYSPADIAFGVSVNTADQDKQDIIPYRHFSPPAINIPIPFQTGYFGIGCNNSDASTKTDTIDNVKLFSSSGPFVSGVDFDASSDTDGDPYDTYIISDDTFDFSHNLRKVINSYKANMVIGSATATSGFKGYFQISEDNNSLLPTRMYDNYLRLEADVNPNGLQWNYIESDVNSTDRVRINDSFDYLDSFAWQKLQSSTSGIIQATDNNLEVRTYGQPVPSGMHYWAVKTQETYDTASGLMVECDMFAPRDEAIATRESYVLFSDQNISAPSGISRIVVTDPIATTQEGLMLHLKQYQYSSTSTRYNALSVVEIHKGVHTSGYYEVESDSNASLPIDVFSHVKMRYRWQETDTTKNEVLVSLNDEIKLSKLDSNVSMPSGWAYFGTRTQTWDATDQGEAYYTWWNKLKVIQPLRTLASSTRSVSHPLNENLTLDISSNRTRANLANLSDDYLYSGKRYGTFTKGYVSLGIETEDSETRGVDFYDIQLTNNGGASVITFDPRWQKVKTPRAQGGEYIETTTSGVFFDFDFEGTALKLVMYRGEDCGKMQVDIDGTTVAGFDPYDLYYDKEWHYFQGVDPSVAENPSVIDVASGLSSGTHTCRITAVVSGYPQNIKFDAAHIYRISRDDAEFTFSTSTHLENFGVNISDDDIRNDIIVVGKRFNTFDASDPANPVYDYVLSRAVDPDSFSDPSATNYIGERKTTVIIEPKIITQERADYAAFLTLQRYRQAQALTTMDGTAVSFLEPNDVISVTDSKHNTTTSHLFALNGISSKQDDMSYLATYEINPFRPYASYQPQLQANISDYNNEALVNIRIEVIDDKGTPTPVKQYTEDNPFDPYYCDPDKGEYRIKFTWDQIIDGIVYINVYRDDGTDEGDIVRGGNLDSDEAQANGRLFNKAVDSGLDRFEVWDCTANNSYYRYNKADETDTYLDSPPAYKLFFEFVHIDRAGTKRRIRTVNESVVNSEMPQYLWVQLGEKIEISDIVVDNMFSMTYEGIDTAGTAVVSDNVEVKTLDVGGGGFIKDGVRFRVKLLNNVANSTEDGLKLYVYRHRMSWAKWHYLGAIHNRCYVDNELAVKDMTAGMRNYDGSTSKNEWYNTITINKRMGASYNYTEPSDADVSKNIIGINGKDRWPNTEYIAAFNIDSLDGMKGDTIFYNTETGGPSSGRLAGVYWPQWTFVSGNGNQFPMGSEASNGLQKFYPTAALVDSDNQPLFYWFKTGKELILDEVITIKAEAIDNSGWRKATATKTVHLHKAKDNTNMKRAFSDGSTFTGRYFSYDWSYVPNWRDYNLYYPPGNFVALLSGPPPPGYQFIEQGGYSGDVQSYFTSDCNVYSKGILLNP